MSGRTKRPPKTKSSIIYCDEKFNCDGERSEANYECVECGTKQCGNCELALHSGKLDWHERRLIAPPPSDELCQSACDKKNYADVSCDECSINLCNTCNERIHSKSRKKNHKRRPFTLVEDANQSELTECLTEYFSLGSNPDHSIEDHFASVDLKQDMAAMAVNKSAPCTLPPGDTQTNGIHTSKRTESINKGKTDRYQSDMPTRDKPLSRRHGNTNDIDEEIYSKCKAFLLADQEENIKVQDDENFLANLRCDSQQQVKVVSIFGNTGDGKSHTLNHTFFGGREIFITSPSQKSCTVGVWTAYDPVHEAVIIDTEGLLGISPNQNQRTRLLLKILAVSDIVIYRTKADRLHNDLFTFLGDASKAYCKHFNAELKAASKRCNLEIPLSCLGPAVILFHETQHTDILGKDTRESPDALLKTRFAELEQDISAYSSIQYVGTRTNAPPTDFNGLLVAVKAQLRNTTVRSPRRPQVIFRALKVLNEKFSGEIERSHPSTFPDQYFTCTAECLACRSRCTQTVNHGNDQQPHTCAAKCKYRDQYENRVYLCKACHEHGREEVVVPKTGSSKENQWLALASYAWSGYVLECGNCGVIYRSRQFWYGNEDPVKSVVRTEIRHIWPGSPRQLGGTHNAARRVLDGLHFMSESIASVSARPTKAVSMWLTDRIAPPYWVPNSMITCCAQCKQLFDNSQQIHHCRACGHGFCDLCSEKKRPVPERGWGLEAVRVCDNCYNQQSSMSDSGSSDQDSNAVMPRKLGEAIGSTVGAVASVVNYPLDILQDSARPSYWVPNHKIKKCCVCVEQFGPKLSIHHCRSCGQGVCNCCSAHRLTVPSRGWDHPVRVCETCAKKPAL